MVGCNQKDVVNFDETSTITIGERVSDESSDEYDVISKIEDEDEVQKIIDIFTDVNWDKNIDIDMDEGPGYKLNKDYEIWVTPENDALEIFNRNNGYYVKLPEDDSSVLFNIITGKQLESE